MEEAQFEVDFDILYDKAFNDFEECESFLKEWAPQNEFELVKPTSLKGESIYLQCSRVGKSRRGPETEGKRKQKVQKKQVILLTIQS